VRATKHSELVVLKKTISGGSMARVLIVDDSPTEIQKMKSILTKNGHDVIEAGGGQEGVDTTKAELPDVVLMDIVMPGVNGFQATRQIKQNDSTSHIPVIIVTTKNQDTDRIWSQRQGAVGYLVKPIDEKQLLKTIKEVL
jgi:twitching motility two-component system response regulator PilH